MREYYRKITALLPIANGLNQVRRGWRYISVLQKYYAEYALTVFILLLITLSWQLYDLINTYNQVRGERTHAINRLTYWSKVIENHQNFPDAYYQAAVYSYSLGEANRAEGFLEKALFLDPQFKKALELKKKIE